MPNIKVNVSLYGSIARYANGNNVAQFNIEVEPGTYKSKLLATLGISESERGFVFINSVLSDAPGLITESDAPFKEGDHIGIFAIDYMWPYQYRDGVRMSEGLKRAMAEHGAMHHIYDVKQ